MKKITLLSLITILFINNLVSQKDPKGINDDKIGRTSGGINDDKIGRTSGGINDDKIGRNSGGINDDKIGVFSCGVSKVSDINNNSYNTIIIGTQCWMQSNLKVSKYRNGAAIPTGLSDGAWANTTSGAYAFYANSNANDAIYGKLYNWYAVKDVRGLCPTGWHVPRDAEWTTLTTYLGGESVAGGKMKSIGTTYWNSPNEGATNVSGFSVLPGGYRSSDGSFGNIRVFAFFWSATEGDDSLAWYRSLGSLGGSVSRGTSSKSVGASVRCLRD